MGLRAGRLRRCSGRLTAIGGLLLAASLALAQDRPQLGPPSPSQPSRPGEPVPPEPTPEVPADQPPTVESAGATGVPLGEDQAQLAADYLRQNDRDRTITASGDVYAQWRDLRVTGETARLDRRADELTVGGPVIVNRDDGTVLETDQFRLDLAKHWYTTGPFSAVFPPETIGYGVVEPVNVYGADSFSIRDTYFAAHRVVFTACPPNDQKYKVTAKTIAVVPNKKIIFRSAKAYLFNVPIFAWGKLVIPLRRFRRTEWLPEFGRSDVYGFFGRMRYFYDLAETQYGNLSGMMTEKRGAFVGVEHDYGWGSDDFAGLGRIDLEYGSRQSELSFRGNLDQSFGEQTKLLINGSFSQNSGFSTTSSQSNATASLTHRFDYGSTNFGYSRSSSASGANFSSFTRHTLNQRFDLGPIFAADLNADWAHRQSNTTAIDDELLTRMRFDGRWTLFDWQVLDERRFDLEGSSFAADDNRAVTEIVPQLTLTTDSRRLNLPLGDLFNLRLDTNIGQFREFVLNPTTNLTSRSTVLRANFDINGDMARFAVGERLRFLSNFRYSQSFFDHPDPAAKYILAFAPTMEWQPWTNTRFDLRYRWQEVAGYSPLSRFDFAQTLNDLDYTASFFVPDPIRPRDGKLSLTINGGYDMLRGQHRDLRVSLTARPSDPLQLSLNTSYSLGGFGGAGFRSLLGEVYYDGGDRYRHEVGFNYDFRNGRVANIDSLVTIVPLPRITVQNALTYDGFQEKVTFNDLLVTYDLGCVDVVGTYRQQAGEFRIDINLKAFPGLASLFGTGRFGQQFSTSQGLQF